MSAVGFGLFMLAVIAASCVLGYAWGRRDAMAQSPIRPPAPEPSHEQ